MKGRSHEFVTADLRGLKADLVAHASARHVSVSAVVRAAVERELGIHAAGKEPAVGLPIPSSSARPVKLSLRLTRGDAERLAAGAERAGLSRGAFLAGLLAGVPVLACGGSSRTACVTALTASTAELATLSRGMHRLVSLLRASQVQAAQEYRRLLDSLDSDVRKHLTLAAGVLADLRPSLVSMRGGDPGRVSAA